MKTDIKTVVQVNNVTHCIIMCIALFKNIKEYIRFVYNQSSNQPPFDVPINQCHYSFIGQCPVGGKCLSLFNLLIFYIVLVLRL